MAGKKPTSSARGGKRAAKPDDSDGGDGAGEDEDEGEGEGTEDRDDGGATAGRIPRDAAVVRDILKSMVRASDRARGEWFLF